MNALITVINIILAIFTFWAKEGFVILAERMEEAALDILIDTGVCVCARAHGRTCGVEYQQAICSSQEVTNDSKTMPQFLIQPCSDQLTLPIWPGKAPFPSSGLSAAGLTSQGLSDVPYQAPATSGFYACPSTNTIAFTPHDKPPPGDDILPFTSSGSDLMGVPAG